MLQISTSGKHILLLSAPQCELKIHLGSHHTCSFDLVAEVVGLGFSIDLTWFQPEFDFRPRIGEPLLVSWSDAFVPGMSSSALAFFSIPANFSLS